MSLAKGAGKMALYPNIHNDRQESTNENYKETTMKTTIARVATYMILLGILSLGSGAAAVQAQSLSQSSAANNSLSGPVHAEWKSLPAPYNRSVTELNAMLAYDTKQGSDTLARKVWQLEPAPYSRSIYELNR
jgi:hypothetical protein